MGSGRDIVVTAYGHDHTVDKIAVSSFESSSDRWGGGSDSMTYCKMINALKLEGNSWVYAKVVPENTHFDPKMVIPDRLLFPDLILIMDNRDVQKVLREIDSWNLTKALKWTDKAVLDKVFQNMSKRGGTIIKEEMEYMGRIRLSDVEDSQNKIVAIIRHLEETGEIIITRTKEEVSK